MFPWVFQVVPVNDEPPQLSRGLRGELRCEEGGRVQVSLDYLRATDPDSEDSRLSYVLTRRPAHGQLTNQGLEVERFTQQDLLQGHVYYVHTGEDLWTPRGGCQTPTGGGSGPPPGVC